MQRPGAEENAYKEVLAICRRLAPGSPVYRSELAVTLTRLAGSYQDTNRLNDAEQAYTEAVAIYRGLAGRNPAYLPQVAAALGALAAIYGDTHRFAAAEARREAAAIQQRLAAH